MRNHAELFSFLNSCAELAEPHTKMKVWAYFFEDDASNGPTATKIEREQ